jgi:hypothetical protein
MPARSSRETRKKRAILTLALRGLAPEVISQKTSVPVPRILKTLAALNIEVGQQDKSATANKSGGSK